MRIRGTSGSTERRVPTSGQGIVPRRTTHNPSLSPFPLSSPHPLMLLSLSILRDFPSLCLALSSLTHSPPHTHTHTHTHLHHLHLFSPFSLFSLYSLSPQSAVTAATFSRPLIYYRSPSQKGPFKKDNVPRLNTHTHTHTPSYSYSTHRFCTYCT